MGKSEVVEAKALWKQIAKNSPVNDTQFELEIHRKLLDVFHPGKYYYYILDCTTAQMDLVSDSVHLVLGYKPHEFTVDFIMSMMHPEDLEYFMVFEQKVTTFFNTLPADKVMKYKVNYDFRLKSQSGGYIRLLHQAAAVQSDENGAVIRVLGIHTDISKIKKENGSSLSFIGLDGEPDYEDVLKVKSTRKHIAPDNLSKRELEIYALLIQGKTSFEIAEILFISKFTVDTHRRNILAKTKAKSITALVMSSQFDIN